MTPYLPETVKGCILGIDEALNRLYTDDMDTDQADTLIHINDMLYNMADMFGFDLHKENNNE